jgi:ABC-type transport system substrate-binding protein
MYTNKSLLSFDLYNNEKIVGDLAERWDVAPDGKQISFAVCQGVKFHDRSDFTCADAYGLEKLADPKRVFPPPSSVLDSVFVSASARPPWSASSPSSARAVHADLGQVTHASLIDSPAIPAAPSRDRR